MGPQQLTLSEINAAAERISGHVRRTPVLSSPYIDALVGARVYAKAEPLQRGGSFKARGAFSRLTLLSPAERRAGVVAYSSGNHGAAVALAARELGIPAAVVVPHDAPAAKLATIAFHGAELYRYDPATEDRAELAAALAHQRQMTMVPPFDDLSVMAGQGTAGLELAEQAPELDLVVIPVGGGGLLAGVGTALRALRPAVRIVGVEPAAADDTRRSLESGSRVALSEPPQTIADGLRTPAPGELTFPINAELLGQVVTVDDADITEAMRICFEWLKLVVEPSGAAALAALTSGRLKADGLTVGVVLSGGNIEPERFRELTVDTDGTSPPPIEASHFVTQPGRPS